MGSLSVGSVALTAVPHYLGVEPLWISSWHGEHSRAARPPPLRGVAITLCWESLANEDWEQSGGAGVGQVTLRKPCVG